MGLDRDALIALLRRNTDEPGWLQPLLDDPDSAAVLGAQVEVFARLGGTIESNTAQGTISGASGGQPGTSSLTVSRETSGTTGTIPRGYPFVDARGVRATLQADVPVGGGVTSLVLPLQTERESEVVLSEDDPLWEVAPDAPSVPGSAGILIAPAGAAGVTATTFQQLGPATPIEGAMADHLSIHGGERGMPRQPGEETADYRQRIRNIPDAVSPIAVADVVQAMAQRPGLPGFLTLEPFDMGETTALKDLHRLGSFASIYCDDDGDGHGFLDDAFSGDRLVDRRTATAYMEIAAQDLVRDPDGGVMYLDDGFADDPVLGFSDVEDGLSPDVVAALLAMLTHANLIKAGGVNIDLTLKSGDWIADDGTSALLAFALVASLTPPVGTIWRVEELLAGVDSATPSPAIEMRIVYNLEGGGTFTPPDMRRSDTPRVPLPDARVASIYGYVASDGSLPAHLVLQAKVLPIIV